MEKSNGLGIMLVHLPNNHNNPLSCNNHSYNHSYNHNHNHCNRTYLQPTLPPLLQKAKGWLVRARDRKQCVWQQIPLPQQQARPRDQRERKVTYPLKYTTQSLPSPSPSDPHSPSHSSPSHIFLHYNPQPTHHTTPHHPHTSPSPPL